MTFQLDWNHYRQETFNHLLLGIQYIYGFTVPGEVAEFGTASGETAEALAVAIKMADEKFSYSLTAANLPKKNLHLFDSFVGLPEASTDIDRKTPHVQQGVWSYRSCTGLSHVELATLMLQTLPADRLFIYEGWYSDTVPNIHPDTKFALLHIDCDLYSSTMDVLVPMFEKNMISPGALILFDDWNCNAASPEFGERRAWAELVDRFGINFSVAGDYGFGGHKVFVHSYTP